MSTPGFEILAAQSLVECLHKELQTHRLIETTVSIVVKAEKPIDVND